MSNYRQYMHSQDDGKADLSPWVPAEPPPSELQELERRRSADVDTYLDPKIITSNPVEIGFQSMAALQFEHHFNSILAENAKKCGYKRLRVVQAGVLPYLLKGADAALLTLAGTGKTTAYLLPLIQRVYEDLRKNPHLKCHVRAVILVNGKEQAKHTLDKIRALTAGLNIKSAMMVSHMTRDAFGRRDDADILVTSAFLFQENLNGNRLTTRFLRYVVVDGIDDLRKDWNFKPMTIDNVLEYVKEISKAQFVYVADDPHAIQQEFWNELIVGNGGSKTVIIENDPSMRFPPIQHLFLRVRWSDTIPVIMETIFQAGRGGQTRILVTNRVRDHDSFIEMLQRILKDNGLRNEYYNTLMSMGDREKILNAFAMEEFPVLITKFTCQIRNYRFPGLKQLIHVGPPFHRDETYVTSYCYSSRPVAFNPNARSVVLFNVDDFHQCGQNVRDLVQAIKASEDGVEKKMRFKVPDWAQYFVESGATEWRNVDKVAAGQKTDLYNLMPEEEAPLPNLPRFDEPPVEELHNIYGREKNNQDFQPPPGLPAPDGATSVDNFNNRDRRNNDEFPNYSRPQSGYQVPTSSEPRFYDDFGHQEQQQSSYKTPYDDRRRNDSVNGVRVPAPQQHNSYRQPSVASHSSGNNYSNNNYRVNQPQEYWNSNTRQENGGNGQQRCQDYGNRGYDRDEGYGEYNGSHYDEYAPRQGGYDRPQQSRHYQDNDHPQRYREDFREAPINNQRNEYAPKQQQQGRFHEEPRYNDFGQQQQNGCRGGQERREYDRPPQQQNRYPQEQQQRYEEPPRQMERNRQPQYTDYRQDEYRRQEEQHNYGGSRHSNNGDQPNSRRSNSGSHDSRPRPQGFDPRQSDDYSFSESFNSRNSGQSSSHCQENMQNFGRNDQHGEDFGRGAQENRFERNAAPQDYRNGGNQRRDEGFRSDFPLKNGQQQGQNAYGQNFNSRPDSGRHGDRRGDFQQQQQRPADNRNNYAPQKNRLERNAAPQDYRNEGNQRRDDGFRSDFPIPTGVPTDFFGTPLKPGEQQGQNMKRQDENVGSVGKRFQGMTVMPRKSASCGQGSVGTGPSGSRDGPNRNNLRGRGGRGGRGCRSPQKNRSPVKAAPSTSFSDFYAAKEEREEQIAKKEAEKRQLKEEKTETVEPKKEEAKVESVREQTQEEKEPKAEKQSPTVERSSETEEEADAEDSDDETHFRTARRRAGTESSEESQPDVV